MRNLRRSHDMTPLRSTAVLAAALVLASVPVLAAGASPGLAGHWEGAIAIPGAAMSILVDIAKGADGAFIGTIDIPAQQAKGLKLTGVKAGDPASFAIDGVPGTPTFSGSISSDGIHLAGTFT